jgi:hypothetical protein
MTFVHFNMSKRLTIRSGKGRVENTNAAVSPSSSDLRNKTAHVALPAGHVNSTA